MSHEKELRISLIGLEDHKVYLAHADGKWGPETPNSDYEDHQFQLDGLDLVCRTTCLEVGEKFKVVVVGFSDQEAAKRAFDARTREGVVVGTRFDWDDGQKTFWLLIPGFPVVNPGKWNQNNVYQNQ